MKKIVLAAACFFYIQFLGAQDRYCIAISEIFADPTPAVGLPAYEWIEIKNVSTVSLNIQGWRLGDLNSQSGPFPVFNLMPDSSVIICSSGALSSLTALGTAISVTSFPSLDNDGDRLYLKSLSGKIIHAVSYETTWYGNELKAQGGWSLEMIDPNNPCEGPGNWKASTDLKGGTPGKKNSVDARKADEEIPNLLKTYVTDSLSIHLVFDETLDSASAVILSNYELPAGPAILNAACLPPLFNEVQLKLSYPMERRQIYPVSVKRVRDCAGNTMKDTETRTGIPEFPQTGDWIINEILFDPRPNGYDYVEFYNAGNSILDLSDLYIASRNADGVIVSMKVLSEQPRLVLPGEYIVVTENALSLSHQYLVSAPRQVIEPGNLPSFPDDKGVVAGLDSRGVITDELRYDKKWHFKLISNPEGVSLERISAKGASQEPMNWQSAASTAGYGTPGYKNSQYLPSGNGATLVNIEPKIFSPDNDGRDDNLFFRYQAGTPGYVANVYIFDIHGHLVRHLMNNALVGIEGHWKWDGLDDKGMKLPASVYIVFTELFDLEGKKLIFKEAIALARP